MQTAKIFIKRNGPVFILGLVIVAVFLIIILANPEKDRTTPAGFKKVGEEIFEREPAEPTPETKPMEYASQVASPENKGKKYFYGEYDPNLRDEQGYPIPPKPDTVIYPANMQPEVAGLLKMKADEEYSKRLQVVRIDFTEQGFTPADTSGWTGSKIIWTNKTNRDIKIVQTLPIHDALKDGVNLKPGESFEFRPLKNKQFTYMELSSQKYGSLFISDSTQPLIRGLSD